MIKLILAVLLALPSLLLTVVTAPIIAVLSIPSLLLLVFRKEGVPSSSNTTKKKPTHVVVFGGSKGIGLAIAKECACKKDLGKNLKITILARNQEVLDRAKEEIKLVAVDSTTTVEAISANVSDYSSLEAIATKIANRNERTILFNCAGIPYTLEYDRIPIETYEKLCKTNLLGSMYISRAFLPHMEDGCIVLCSSALGQVGMYGYTAYAPTKFALRGFAEALHAELVKSKPGVGIQLAFPVDTDTPGYEEELKTMPEITKKLNDAGGLAKPEDVAKTMVKRALAKNPTFNVYLTFEGWMLSSLTAGMSPVSNLMDAVTQVSLGGLFRFISLFYLNDWWNTIRYYRDQEKKQK